METGNEIGLKVNNISVSTNTCITLEEGVTAKICNKNGKTKIMIENKEVKEEEPKFKKGDILSCHIGKKTWIVILKRIDESKKKNKLKYYCSLSYINDTERILLNSSYDDAEWNYATEEEKRNLFLAMLRKGMFWDEKKMKFRTLKDGDVITAKDHNGDTWQSIFKEIKDGKFYSYSDLDCDKKLYKGPFGEVNQILSIRYATFKERQTLFDKIEEQEHKKWNTETKKFEDIRWRAKSGETYWYLTENFHVAWHTEDNDSTDKALGEVNNKFKTKELAEEAANKIKELLSKL